MYLIQIRKFSLCVLIVCKGLNALCRDQKNAICNVMLRKIFANGLDGIVNSFVFARNTEGAIRVMLVVTFVLIHRMSISWQTQKNLQYCPHHPQIFQGRSQYMLQPSGPNIFALFLMYTNALRLVSLCFFETCRVRDSVMLSDLNYSTFYALKE